jgi:hypothetical protein
MVTGTLGVQCVAGAQVVPETAGGDLEPGR